MIDEVAKSHGRSVRETPVGFKYINELGFGKKTGIDLPDEKIEKTVSKVATKENIEKAKDMVSKVATKENIEKVKEKVEDIVEKIKK